jgi:hypothetical protein
LQFGNVHSIRPQQVTFIVPGAEDFKVADIATFIDKAETLEVFLSIQLVLLHDDIECLA